MLLRARKLLQCRRFSKVIRLLESCPADYQDSFEYFYTLGTACLYSNHPAGAEENYRKARKIKMKDTNLMLGLAVLHLRCGDTARALDYYLDPDIDPANRIKREALDFIQKHGDPDTIFEWRERGKLAHFYPPLGYNPVAVRAVVCACIAAVILPGGLFFFLNRRPSSIPGRADLSRFELTAEDRKNALEEDLSANTYRWILTSREILSSYGRARKFFQQGRDNAAQVEVNRLLNSNTAPHIRQNARILMNYFEEPGFDTLIDKYRYQDVAADPPRYQDCWVIWSGRVSNLQTEAKGLTCDFLVGYDTQKTLEGIVPLRFAAAPVIDTARPLQVLAKIALAEGSRITLEGKSVYQPLKQP
jgi:hypothetical protein